MPDHSHPSRHLSSRQSGNLIRRFFDLFFSLIGLILLSPILIAVAFAIRRDGGPIFFRQERIGGNGGVFRIYKFRSMVVNAHKMGAQVTAEHDPRITSVGRLLRKTKLDELPQLLNVFRGEMSLVGPRPEVPFYVAQWPEEDRAIILSVKPGITDYATLFYSDEQAVLARAEDPERAYREQVMPHKLRMYRAYVRDSNPRLDLRIIVATLAKMAGIDIITAETQSTLRGGDF